MNVDQIAVFQPPRLAHTLPIYQRPVQAPQIEQIEIALSTRGAGERDLAAVRRPRRRRDGAHARDLDASLDFPGCDVHDPELVIAAGECASAAMDTRTLRSFASARCRSSRSKRAGFAFSSTAQPLRAHASSIMETSYSAGSRPKSNRPVG